MKIPIFFAKKGWWGEKGMVRISFWKWISFWGPYGPFVTKVRWIKCSIK